MQGRLLDVLVLLFVQVDVDDLGADTKSTTLIYSDGRINARYGFLPAVLETYADEYFHIEQLQIIDACWNASRIGPQGKTPLNQSSEAPSTTGGLPETFYLFNLIDFDYACTF
jgi:hypothetical protein